MEAGAWGQKRGVRGLAGRGWGQGQELGAGAGARGRVQAVWKRASPDPALHIQPPPLLRPPQYDWDAATTIGFLRAHGLQDLFKLNIECNHATLSGHSCEHELQLASLHGMLGNIDANTGGWVGGGGGVGGWVRLLATWLLSRLVGWSASWFGHAVEV